MTESECLVFTNKKIILVSLIDKTQKEISCPEEFCGFLEHSLNVMINGVPFLLIATDRFDQQIVREIEEKYPNQCHTIGERNITPWLLTVMQYNTVEQKMNERVDLSASALFRGDFISYLLQYSVDSIILCPFNNFKTALIFSLPSMQKTKSISINTEQTDKS